VQKRNGERKECEEKEKKRKEVRSTYQSCGSQIFKARFRATVKISWSETWRGCRKL
jgi:hypothetical protein